MEHWWSLRGKDSISEIPRELWDKLGTGRITEFLSATILKDNKKNPKSLNLLSNLGFKKGLWDNVY